MTDPARRSSTSIIVTRPTRKWRPTPNRRWPRARITTEEMDIEGEGEIGLNQKTDQAWVHGPGKLVQLTDRGLLTDKTEETDPEAQKPERNGNESKVLNKTSATKAVKPKPKTRAGKAQATKVPLTITWAEKMFFNGRSTDPENRPAAKAVFYKNVRAEMEDALLYCTKTMTTYTDQPVPLADLGKMSQVWNSRARPRRRTPKTWTRRRKPSPRSPSPTWRSSIAWATPWRSAARSIPNAPSCSAFNRSLGDRLIYDRRTGDFFVPGAGTVYMYDQNKDANKPQEQNSDEPDRQPAADQADFRPPRRPPIRRQTRHARRSREKDGPGCQEQEPRARKHRGQEADPAPDSHPDPFRQGDARAGSARARRPTRPKRAGLSSSPTSRRLADRWPTNGSSSITTACRKIATS